MASTYLQLRVFMGANMAKLVGSNLEPCQRKLDNIDFQRCVAAASKAVIERGEGPPSVTV